MSTVSSSIRDNGLDLKDALRQKAAVKGCADWVHAKVEIKSGNSALEAETDRLERDFVTEGGLRERMTRARLEFRDRATALERQRASLRPPLKVPPVPSPVPPAPASKGIRP